MADLPSFSGRCGLAWHDVPEPRRCGFFSAGDGLPGTAAGSPHVTGASRAAATGPVPGDSAAGLNTSLTPRRVRAGPLRAPFGRDVAASELLPPKRSRTPRRRLENTDQT